MSAGTWAASAVVAASTLLYSLLALTGSAFAWGGAGRPVANGDRAAAGRHRSAAAVLANVVSLVALAAAAVGLVNLFGAALGVPGGGLPAPQLAAGAGVTALGATAIHLAAARLGPDIRGWLRPWLAPLNALLHRAMAIPGVNAFLSPPESLNGPAAGEDAVAAVLEEDLDILQAAGIPVDPRELHMIRGILRMDRVRVREIMRPRVDMVVAPLDSDPDAVADLMAVGGYSKIPVHGETIDDIVGIVFARDLLRAMRDGEGGPSLLPKLARPAIFVPESQSMEQLLREFQQHRASLGIVVDEYGGVSGLVTVTDLVEEIVGDLEDEFDIHEPDVQPINKAETLVDARLSVDSFNRALGTTVEARGFDTVGGLV
ncbi:MAG: HlyC/CorC family transporter, partial [Gemmatimonadetes bacterium]|nr:HlyC/CorC family transporter [Gemmatimonadota bacterium]